MTDKKSLNRRNHKVVESMQRYLSAIDNNLYAAEQVCHQESNGKMYCPDCHIRVSCPLVAKFFPYFNKTRTIRAIIGEHVQQDDPEQHAYAGPCVWAAGYHNGIASKVCLFTGRKGCPEMVMVGNIRTCGRVHD